MTVRTQNLAERKWEEGKAYTFFHSNQALAAGATDQIVICVGDKECALNGFHIESNAENLSWKMSFAEAITFDEQDIIKSIARNMGADQKAGLFSLINPTIGVVGEEIIPTHNILSQENVGGRFYINEDFFRGLFALLPDKCYLIEITNTTGLPYKYELEFNSHKS